VLTALVLLGLAGWLSDQRWPGSYVCVLFAVAPVLGLVGYLAFWLLVLRNRPAQVRRFAVTAQTIQIRFRRPDYAERFLASQAGGGLALEESPIP
jgi:hypothetical protein